MKFFDYLFCRLYWWFTVIIKEKDIPIGSSVIGLSNFQCFTIFPIYIITCSLIYHSYSIKNILGINPFFVIIGIFILINYFHFNKTRYKKLLSTFNKMSPKEKKKKDIFCIVYIVSIIVVNTLLMIYFRSKNLQ